MTYGVRELGVSDIPHIQTYWLDNDPDFLIRMGVDLQKLPNRESLAEMLKEQLARPFEQKQAYALIWEERRSDGICRPIGHCNVNGIVFGESAYMHLHIWKAFSRKRGIGTQLLRDSIPWFFEKLNLQVLYCQPYALNPSPNKTLKKVGFDFVKTYTTIPGSLNFEQKVNLWMLKKK